MNKKSIRRFIVGILAGVVFGLTIIIFAITQSSPASDSALSAMQTDDQVIVSTAEAGWLVFNPQSSEPVVGFIFYPGGNVDPQAYAPLARQIAADGYLVVIPPMPFDLAVFAPNRAADVISAFPGIETWAIGGHSLGGAMAAAYAADHLDQVSALILWASYPANSNDLSASGLSVLSIYGTLDGLASLEEIEKSRSLLPPDTRWVEIKGGNHAQFGDYGEQKGDNSAEISSEKQHALIVEETINVLQQLQ